jgi:hypothetical protein
MGRNLKGVILFLVGALVGSIGLPRSGAAEQYRLQRGQGFWSVASEPQKTAYLLGYLDAETIYRSNMDLKLKPQCAESGKKWLDDFEYKFPLLDESATIVDLQKGLDDFYEHNDIAMFPAQRIVRLKLAGRPQAEIDAAERATQDGAARP